MKHKLDFLFIHCDPAIASLGFTQPFPPMGMIELASFLKAQGLRCAVIDTRHNDFTIPWLIDYLSETKPKWVGIDVLMDSRFTAARLVNIVRAASKTSRIALGGAHATLSTEECITEMDIDAVVIGDGELPCLDLANRSKLADVRGIAFKKGKKIIRTDEPPLMNLDELPLPDYSLVVGMDALNYRGGLCTGRGCPYRCAFCAAGHLRSQVRMRNPKKAVQDILVMRKALGSKFFMILDDTFTIKKKHIEEFCGEIKKVGGGKDFFWYAQARVDLISREPGILSTMRDAGLRMLLFGIESGDEKVLKAYNKGIKISDAEITCEACARENIPLNMSFIIGGPFETPETIAKTRDVACRLATKANGYFQLALFYLNPTPSTPIFEHPEQYGIEMLDPRLFSSVSFDNSVTRTEEVDREELIRQRNHMFAHVWNLAREINDARGEDFHDQMNKLKEEIGINHWSILLHEFEDFTADQLSIGNANYIFRSVASAPQFTLSPGDMRMSCVPARAPYFSIDSNGHYIPVGHSEGLPENESEVFHLCSGKLTGNEIAMLLGTGRTEVDSALESLEKKQAIFYRTY